MYTWFWERMGAQHVVQRVVWPLLGSPTCQACSGQTHTHTHTHIHTHTHTHTHETHAPPKCFDRTYPPGCSACWFPCSWLCISDGSAG